MKSFTPVNNFKAQKSKSGSINAIDSQLKPSLKQTPKDEDDDEEGEEEESQNASDRNVDENVDSERVKAFNVS